MRFSLIFGFLATLLSVDSAFANPTNYLPGSKRAASEIVSRAPLHDCTVWIQRWGHNAFDAWYYDIKWTSTSTKRQLYTIDSVVPIDEGKYLADYQMGSHPLKILNVANPKNAADNGKVSVSWGTYKGDSWNTATGCQTNYNKEFERATYLCYFKCDVPITA